MYSSVKKIEIKTRVYGKQQTSDTRLCLFKINSKHTRIVQNNSCVYGKHESTYLHLVTANGKRQMRRNTEKSWSRGQFCRLPFAVTRVLNSLISQWCIENHKTSIWQFNPDDRCRRYRHRCRRRCLSEI